MDTDKKLQADFDKLWNTYVPSEGMANTLIGNLVLAIGRLEYEYFNNGNGNANDGGDGSIDGFFQNFIDLIRKHVPSAGRDLSKIERIIVTGIGRHDQSDVLQAYENVKRAVVEFVKHEIAGAENRSGGRKIGTWVGKK